MTGCCSAFIVHLGDNAVNRVQLNSVRGFGQSGDTNSGVAFVTNVEADKQGGNLFEDAGGLELAAINGADAGNFCGESADGLIGVRVVAANDYVAVNIGVGF